MTDILQQFDEQLQAAGTASAVACDLMEFLTQHARVRLRNGSYGAYSFTGREPLKFAADLIDKIIRNTKHLEPVVIDGVEYGVIEQDGKKVGALKGATVSICGGAQFGKTVLELNIGGWVTTVEFLNFGYYTSDLMLLSTIIDTKFRPDVIDQIPWMASMIEVGKGESRSGKSVNRKNAFQVSEGDRKAFGYFNGMQKPPTTISLDIAVLDEVDDIPEKNIGFISGRMTNSDVQLTCFIGTQRIHAAGQNARWLAGTMHRRLFTCPACGHEVCMEEQWPGICRIAMDVFPSKTDPKLDETRQYDPDAMYYPACPDCGAALDRTGGRMVAEHPERAKQRNWSIRISQMSCAALPWRDQVSSWFAALADPNPEAMSAWHCDRRGIPYAGAQQPITGAVLSRARTCSLAKRPDELAEMPPQYDMTLGPLNMYSPRIAGMDMGPRCWLWINEVSGPLVRPLVWAEMVASGTAYARCLELYGAGAFRCLFLDAGGEPDLTKRIVLALNGLETYQPPAVPQNDLRRMSLSNIGAGLSWNGDKAMWRGIRSAAVAFSLREAGGVQQDIGFTQDGRIYPLIKCNRGESIQSLVNSFLTPAEGVIQQIETDPGKMELRMLPRQRLPRSCIGAGAPDSVVETHLANLRRCRVEGSSRDDWEDAVENHLGLAAVYAHLAETCLDASARQGGGCAAKSIHSEGTMDRRGMATPMRARRSIA